MKKIFSITLLGSLLLLGASCKKSIDEAYQNPNAPVRVPVNTLLPQIVSAMAANYAGHGPMNDARYAGAYIQSWQYYSTNSYFDQMGYNNGSGDVAQSTWRTHYYDIGQNNQRMMQWAAEEQRWDYVGVGKAIEAWGWMLVADYYGETIVENAFNTSMLTFAFNREDTAYARILSLCQESLANLNRTDGQVDAAYLASGDAYFYNGDVNKWKKFANGILARYYNHFSNKADYKPDSAIYYAKAAMQTVDQIASVKFIGNALSATNNFYGPRRGNLGGASAAAPTAVRQSDFIAKLMTGGNAAFPGVTDPRAWYMLRGNANGTIKGVPPVVGQTALADNDRPENFWGVSQVTASNTAPANDNNCRYIFKNDAPYPVMTPAEMKFIIAEAEYKLGHKTNALTAYQEGISASFDMLTTNYNLSIPAGKEITPAIKASFLALPDVVPANPNDLTLSKIMLQKYIAMYGYGVLETWMDMRRYHYTDLDPETGNQVYTDFQVPTLFADNNGEYIYRYYPRYNAERVWNFYELQRIGATSNNYHTKKLWIVQP